jgi:nucleotide-binding universal stress UspA family protein
MATKIIVSYDGTNNEDDAIALGRLFAQAGAEVSLAYVRHTHDPRSGVEHVQQTEAEAALDRGAELLGDATVERHVVTDPSTPAGLQALAESEGAEVIVFCSDSHTAPGHVSVGNSAQRLLDGGPVAIAIAPAGLAARSDASIRRVAATGDTAARETADAVAQDLGAQVADLTADNIDLLVIGSRDEARSGQVAINATAQYLVEVARSAVLIVPRDRAVRLGAQVSAAGA